MLRDKKILITGPTSQVGVPVVEALAASNEVVGLARFSKADDRERIESLGAKTLAIDLADGDLSAVDEDFDYVVNFAVVKSGDFEYDLRANAEGVGRLMARCAGAKAFLHCSSTAVYAPSPHHAFAEGDPLGDHHRVMMPTYSISKIAAETVARFAARQWKLPTTIARLSVPYGDNGGWPWYHLMMMKNGVPIPVGPHGPNEYNPLHHDDYIAMLPALLEIASVPATTVNWGGSESVSIEEWCAYLGELTGLEPKLNPTEQAIDSAKIDPTLMHQLIGTTKVPWREGIRRMVESLNPELLK